MTDWIVPAAAVLLALLALVLAAALLRARSTTDRALAEARSETAALRERLDRLEHGRREPVRDEQPLLITRLGEDDVDVAPAAPVPVVDGRLFADLVLRESVLQAASLAHGVRRALAPETRNRIRFEMRRELKRARKQRRADLRAAKRLWAEHQQGQEGSAA